jgi:uncharacterized protein YgiM (DUF1202 family)
MSTEGQSPQTGSKGSNTGQIILIVVVVLVAAAVVLMIGILLGNALGGQTEAGPTSVPGVTQSFLEIPPPVAGAPSLTATENLNVRQGPSTDCPSYGLMQVGTTAQAIGISADYGWYAIYFPGANDGKGWVSADYAWAQNVGQLPVLDSLCK